jgi:Methylamine utilisation protein MauE
MIEENAPAIDRKFGRYRSALCGSTLLMVTLSWPLWVDDADFPRVPFLAGLPVFPPWVSWLVLAGIVGTLAMATAGRLWRLMIRISLALLVFAILQDQNRFQPWAYQYAIIGLAMAFLSKARALRLARWYVLGLSFYSGLSKLDASFCRELGPTFLSAALGRFGLSTTNWPESSRTLASLAMPAFEIVVAFLLLFRSTRRIGLVGAIAQHSALVLVLGPWNLGHSTIVLVWNMALIVQDVLLFGPTEIPPEIEPKTTVGLIVELIFWSAMILPIGERLGLCDAWPGHALYASHAERSEVYVHEDDLDRFPDEIRRRLLPTDGVTPWRRLDLTGWSREVRGTPPYPSGRVGNAMAEFLESRFGGPQPARLVQWSRARAWDGHRDRDESLGIRAIQQRGDRFLLNAHTARVARH